MKTLLALIVAVFLASANAAAKIRDIHPYSGYNCSGVANGNYRHPDYCTKFISCSGGIASQRECGACHVDAMTCPDGQLVYEPSKDQCIWANEATCSGSGTNTNSPLSGEDCDPAKGLNDGYCQWFRQCNHKTRKWGEKQECGQDLVWNPNGPAQIHGGNCDTWNNLDNAVEEQYRSDPDCLSWSWKGGECSPKYQYQAPKPRNNNIENLKCSEGLLFDQRKTTCQWCRDVRDKNGNPCPC